MTETLSPKSVPQIYGIFFVRKAFPQKCSSNIRDIFCQKCFSPKEFPKYTRFFLKNSHNFVNLWAKIKCLTFLETSAHVDFKSDDNNKEDEDNKNEDIKGYKNILL